MPLLIVVGSSLVFALLSSIVAIAHEYVRMYEDDIFNIDNATNYGTNCCLFIAILFTPFICVTWWGLSSHSFQANYIALFAFCLLVGLAVQMFFCIVFSNLLGKHTSLRVIDMSSFERLMPR